MSRKPSPRHPAHSTLLCTSQCLFAHFLFFFFFCSAMPGCPTSCCQPDYNSELLSGNTASMTPNPETQTHRLCVNYTHLTHLTLHDLLTECYILIKHSLQYMHTHRQHLFTVHRHPRLHLDTYKAKKRQGI